jgi:hypothetical protein
VVIAATTVISLAMPTETAIIIAGIVLVFAVFVAVFIVVLAWADFYTRNYRAPGAAYFDKPK